MLQRLLSIVVLVFPVSEVALGLVRRSRAATAQRSDRGSLGVLWISIAIGVSLGLLAQGVDIGHLPGPPRVIDAIALVLLVGGLGLRWAAILTLGRLFTVDVAIHADHAVVQTGLYRFMRHPSYTGLLLAFLGLGVFFGSWLSLVCLMVPVIVGILNRVAKEERALLDSLGPDYAAYCARTSRFIPGVL